MLVIGLTGGIGSGKSTVLSLLERRGAVVIDADVHAIGALEPGTPTYKQVVERFGKALLEADGRIDRSRLADIVFSDKKALADLNAIVHPVVWAQIDSRLRNLDKDHPGSDKPPVIVDVPLMVELSFIDVDALLVIDAPEEIAIERLVRDRGMAASDAKARIGAQGTRRDRLGKADFVISNDGSIQHLEGHVEAAWEWISKLKDQAKT